MNTFGNHLKITIFGQSHAPSIGMVIDGFPAGMPVDMDTLQAFLDRRAPRGEAYSTRRKEGDMPQILSGIVDGKTCGAPIAMAIRNTDTRSSDYQSLRDIPRPSHADYAAYVKYGGHNDIAGGGQFSGRLTAPLCIAGGLCMQYLQTRGVYIAAHILSIGDVADTPFDPVHVDCKAIAQAAATQHPVVDASVWKPMLAAIEGARLSADSIGGVIECAATGLPAGLGEPMFGGVENRISAAVFGVPAVKGIAFGSGFEGSRLRGSENNDPFVMDNGRVITRTNNHGGILGGITSGMPVIFQAAMKPTASIGREQDSVSLSAKENVKLVIHGRHDPCIVPRAVPAIEAAAAVALCDLLLDCTQTIGEQPWT